MKRLYHVPMPTTFPPFLTYVDLNAMIILLVGFSVMTNIR